MCYAWTNDQNSCDNVGAFLQIAAMIASLNANMEVLKKAVNSIYSLIDSFNKQWVNMAKFGLSSKFIINQKIAGPNNKKNIRFLIME